MAKFRALVDALRDVRAQRERIADLERELIRISPQIAALEQRVEDLRTRLEGLKSPFEEGDMSEGKSLLEEVRSEHARVRARISAASVFEERLRVLEERLAVDSATGRPKTDLQR